MRKKFLIIFSLVALIALTLSFTVVLAKNKQAVDDQNLPEEEGVYDVSGHPGMKLRVFVHRAKPGPAPEPTLQCSLPDPASDAMVAGAGWRIPSGISWKYRVNPNVPASLGSGLSSIVTNSFAAWTGALPASSGITLAYDGTTAANRAVGDGQNIIAWGRTSGSALGVTYIWYQNGVALELDTIMNQKFSWYWSDPATWGSEPTCAYTGVYDAQNILTHELGHWFGLDDHYTSDYTNNTMYGYGSKGEVKKDTPTAGDITGLNSLYQ